MRFFQRKGAKRGADDSMTLVAIAQQLHNESINRVVASLGERRVASLRAFVLGIVLIWVWAWKQYGPQPVLVQDANAVYGWAVGLFLASLAWWVVVRAGWVRNTAWMDPLGTVANFLIVAILTTHAFLLLITLEAVLPFLAVTVGARYSRRWFQVGVAASLAILLWSAPPGYWISRPAYLVYAVVLTVGLPLLIGRVLSALRAVSVQALEARDAQNRFVGAMSHELRTPLNVIINSIALIDREGLSADQRVLLDQSGSSAKALSYRVNNVLDVAKHNASSLQLGSEPLGIEDLVKTVRDVCSPSAIERGIEFRADIAANVPPVLVGDPGRIEQVLSNLATNAIKFTPPGGRVTVNVRLAAPVSEGHAELVCTVADTGIGISDDDKKRIFDAFYQVSAGGTRRHGGVGLGLFIVRSVTQQMRGTLAVDANPGGGTVFTWCVRLPVGSAAALSSRPGTLLNALREHKARTPSMQCLLIEDNLANVDIMQRLLASAGHMITVATDGPSGLQALAGQSFDLVFLDLHMPGMSGWDVLDALDATVSASAARPPVVVLSAESEPEAVSMAMTKGAVGFVSKPIVAHRLLDAIERIAGTAAAETPPPPEVGISPLSELREISSGSDIGSFLQSVESGIGGAIWAAEQAIAGGDTQQTMHHLHSLKNEFSAIGISSSISSAQRLESAVQHGSDIGRELAALQREALETISWIRAQPEYPRVAVQ